MGSGRRPSFLRRELRGRVNLRHTPHLTFALDDSIAEGDRVLRLMDGFSPEQLAAADPPRAEPRRRRRAPGGYGGQ